MKKIITCRPTCAAYLIEHGISCKRCINPYNPERAAWDFDGSPEALKLVVEYYNRIEKAVPLSVRHALDELENGAKND